VAALLQRSNRLVLCVNTAALTDKKKEKIERKEKGDLSFDRGLMKERESTGDLLSASRHRWQTSRWPLPSVCVCVCVYQRQTKRAKVPTITTTIAAAVASATATVRPTSINASVFV